MKFYDVIRQAVADMTEHGFDNESRVTYWTEQIKQAAIENMVPVHVMEQTIRSSLGMVYKRLVERGGLLKLHKGVAKYTIDKVKPQLRAELDRRIMASANLIKLNREQMVATTLRRFQGWATSIPAGGSDVVSRAVEAGKIKKALASQSYEMRRCSIDQGHKLAATLSDIVAKDGGALALVWRSHWRQSGYNYREDHKERDGHCYAIRGNWALERGLMKPGPDGYYDQITAVGEEVYCRCYGVWLYHLRDLEEFGMVTPKGKSELASARKKLAAM